MSRTGTLILLGILIIVTPYSGLPIAIRTLLAVVFGALVAGIGLLIRSTEAQRQKQSGEAKLSTVESPEPQTEESAPSGVSPI